MNNLDDKDLAKIALDNKLFVRGWQLEQDYRWIIEGSSELGIHVIFENQEPIACSVIMFEDNLISCYVKPKFRKLGYGKRLVSEILTKYNLTKYNIYGTSGIKGSDKFYKKIGLAFFKDYIDINYDENKLIFNSEEPSKKMKELILNKIEKQINLQSLENKKRKI